MNFLKGFVIGIGKIIPGVSGAVLAIIMGVYDKAIYYICNFKSNVYEGSKYLVSLGIGIIVSIILFSKIISYCLSEYYVITMLFFIGLIIGGVPTIISKVKRNDYYIAFISFLFFFFISIWGCDNSYIIKNNFTDLIMFFISGILEAIGTIVPGVSGTALLMILGTYNIIISSLGNITNISYFLANLKIIVPFVMGTIIGIILFVKLVDYLFRKYSDSVYSFILGILISSIFLLVFQVFKVRVYFFNLFLGIIFMILGIVISNFFKEK